MQDMRAAGDSHRAPLRRGDLAQGGGDQRHRRRLFLFYDGIVQNAMTGLRLYCDEMLARLRRRVRAAGDDTAIAEGGLPDTALIARCVAEGRVLLTRDRHLAGIADGRVTIIRLTETDLAGQARALRSRLGIDWRDAPVTRRLLANNPPPPAPP